MWYAKNIAIFVNTDVKHDGGDNSTNQKISLKHPAVSIHSFSQSLCDYTQKNTYIQQYSLIKFSITSQFLKKVNKKTIYSLYTETESSLNGLTVSNEVCSVLSFLAKQLLTSLFAYRPMIRWMVHVSHHTCEDPVPSAKSLLFAQRIPRRHVFSRKSSINLVEAIFLDAHSEIMIHQETV